MECERAWGPRGFEARFRRTISGRGKSSAVFKDLRSFWFPLSGCDLHCGDNFFLSEKSKLTTLLFCTSLKDFDNTVSLSLSLSLSSFQDSSLFSFLLAEQLSCTAHTQKEQQKMNGRDASSDASMPLATRVQPTMSSKYNERSSFQRKLNMVRSSVISSCLQLRLVDDVARKPHNRWPEKEKQVDPPSKCLRSYD